MIRQSDGVGLAGFEDDLPGLPGGIRSDVGPAARGLSVAQHAATILAHLCRETP
jgi:hypothetical protein